MRADFKILTLYLIIILEGYIVLASELIAMRQIIPYVGNGTDTASIIIAAVLLPMAIGYHIGGQYVQRRKNGSHQPIRKKLLRNILLASVFLCLGLSLPSVEGFFVNMQRSGLSSRLILTALYAALFIAPPTYLLAQTVPLICNYVPKGRLSQITGKILFFSTTGSFLGAVFSTLILMTYFGVNNTVSINFIILFVLILILSKKIISKTTVASLLITLLAFFLNSPFMMHQHYIVAHNVYNKIAVFNRADGANFMLLNGDYSSMYRPADGAVYDYIAKIDDIVLKPIRYSKPPKDILVIGAGAFTIGAEDTHNIYAFVDIDASLKALAEEHILKRKLHDNVTFHATPARAFFNQNKKQYDAIILDTYQGDGMIPEHLVTAEFFDQVRRALKPGGIAAANFVSAPNFGSAFSKRLDNTWRAIFPYTSRMSKFEFYGLWQKDSTLKNNILYFARIDNRQEDTIAPNEIYTDNKNTMFLDREPKRKWR